jgi:hypothetical protein
MSGYAFWSNPTYKGGMCVAECPCGAIMMQAEAI